MKVKIYNNKDKILEILHCDELSFIETSNEEDCIKAVEELVEFTDTESIVIIRYKKPVERHYSGESK